MFATLLVLIAIIAIAVNGEYKKIVSEECATLQSSDNLFNQLLPCASYSSEPVDMACFAAAEIPNALKTVPGDKSAKIVEWTFIANTTTGPAIKKHFEFEDFQHAFLFMSEVAQLAETNQHHPLWTNLWNEVDVTLNTDDQECLSTFDIKLAEAMDSVEKMQKAKKL